ncbi:MAG: hypothetical protein GEU93_02185 [Propionibacteriales bacterium]|nr:hypothetical protein [Propionibacteriales bacterium]
MGNKPNDNSTATSRLARQAIDNLIAIHLRQVPQPIADRAVSLLTCIYICSSKHGVDPATWGAVAALPSAVLDAVILTEGRES